MKQRWRWPTGGLAAAMFLTACDARTPPPTTAAAPKSGAQAPVVGGPPAAAQGAVRRGIDRQTAQAHFGQIGIFYHQYNAEMGRSPASLKEFDTYIRRDAPQIAQALQEDRYVVVWKANLASNNVLAYEKAAYTDGSRLVMMGDKSIKIMSAQEFQRALQAAGR
jgi:hypothetical protein